MMLDIDLIYRTITMFLTFMVLAVYAKIASRFEETWLGITLRTIWALPVLWLIGFLMDPVMSAWDTMEVVHNPMKERLAIWLADLF